MKYDFNTLEAFNALRTTLKQLRKDLSLLHHSVVCKTSLRKIRSKFKEIRKFIENYKKTENYDLLSQYIAHTGCHNFLGHLDDEFLSSLKQRTYTLQEIFSILKQLSLTINELDQEVININERYFL